MMAQRTRCAPFIANHFKSFMKFQGFVRHEGHRTSSARNRRRIISRNADEEGGFQYGATTGCLSSYYSIFVVRLAIMVMLAILIGMLTMLTWHFTKVYTRSTLNSLAYDFRYELLQRPVLRMWNILNSTVEMTKAQVQLSEYIINHYEHPLSQPRKTEMHEAMRKITWALFASRNALNAITISYRDGFVQAFHRDNKRNSTFYIYSNHANSSMHNSSAESNIWYGVPLDPVTGIEIGNPRKIPPESLINIVGLSDVREGVASWHVAVSKFTDSPLLSAALPVRYPSDGNIVAAVGVTAPLYGVGQLMRELVESYSGYMYLTSLEGYVLATSTSSPLTRNTSSSRTLMFASDLEDSVIQAGAGWLKQAYGDRFPINHEVHVENVMLGQKRYYIDSFFLNLKRLPLVGVIIIPREFIMGKVDKIGFTTLIIMISASLCTLAVGCVCIMVLTTGVSKEMNLRAELISHLDARRRAEASSNYKSQFLANMSHELRTPMAAVIGLLDILIGDDCLTNEQFATITQIRKCSTALLRLLNNILDLSKVESGKLVLEERDFNLTRELEGLVDMFSVQCNNQNVEIVLDLSDDIPNVVRGDSARVVQIFTNLISNSIKFTTVGHIVLRGWCEYHSFNNLKLLQDQEWSQRLWGIKENKHKDDIEQDHDKVTIWFEVDDTGCGIDPCKWESVFESFEQADPSTTRKHGGTGLGLCIVRNLVNKMGGEIRVNKKNSAGTLMQLHLVLGLPPHSVRRSLEIKFGGHNLTVLLALSGSKVRSILSQWLREKGIPTMEASEWNELTKILQDIYPLTRLDASVISENTNKYLLQSTTQVISSNTHNQNTQAPDIVVIMDSSQLDLRTSIWKQQLIFLDQYHGKTKFFWVLSHDISNSVKLELQKNGHFLMVNKPLYKTKVVQILEAVVSQMNIEDHGSTRNSRTSEDFPECHEMDSVRFDCASSDDLEILDVDHISNKSTVNPGYCLQHLNCRISTEGKCQCQFTSCLDNFLKCPDHLLTDNTCHILGRSAATRNFGDIYNKITRMRSDSRNKVGKEEEGTELVEWQKKFATETEVDSCSSTCRLSKDFRQQYLEEKVMSRMNQQNEDMILTETNLSAACNSSNAKISQIDIEFASGMLKPCNDLKDALEKRRCTARPVPSLPLQGLSILLAEDTPILQRVATKMLEKMGAIVKTVVDGLQAVDILQETHNNWSSTLKEAKSISQLRYPGHPAFDLILMDCQMPKLDGYEATRAIRRMEAEIGWHIPIVALTAHAMSSDEAKCLEVGMDAYLTKPIDSKLMVDTILSLTTTTAVKYYHKETYTM